MIIRKLEALFTLNTNAAQFKKAVSELDNLASKAEKVMNAIAGYWAVQALQNILTNTASAMAEVGKTAGYLGIATDALQELRYTAEKSGVSIDTLEDSLKELMIRSVDAKAGSGEAAEAFQALGKLTPIDAFGRMREPLELLNEVADRLNKLPTQSDRMWVVDSMFGDQGAQMLKMLKGGSKGLQEMRLEARLLGHLLRSEAVADAERFTKTLKRLQIASRGTGQSLLQDFFKPLSWIIERLSDLSVTINKTHVSASTFRIALASLSVALAAVAVKSAIIFAPLLVQAAPMIGMVGLIGAGFIGLVAIAEDLWVALKGGNSVFAIEGEVKGVKLQCEKTLELDRGGWGVMCRAGNDIDVKYRMQRFNDEHTKVEFLVSKEKNGEQKLLAAPIMIIKDRHPSSSESATHNSNISIKAERVK